MYIIEFEAERFVEEFVLFEWVKSIFICSIECSYFIEALRDFLLNRSDVLGDMF